MRPGIGCGLLEHDPDPVAPLAAAVGGVDAEHGDVSGAAREEAFEDLDGRRLAGAVRAEEGEDLAGGDLEVDAANGLRRSVVLLQPVHANGDLARRRRRRATGAGPDLAAPAEHWSVMLVSLR